ncbi:MAG: hypothetical protein NUW37_19715 [Planctomycetes bacterium]|nr:hypothetical protein [Planctomycetota bacterium]
MGEKTEPQDNTITVELVSCTDPALIEPEIARIGPSTTGGKIMLKKGVFLVIRVNNIRNAAALCIKQDMLSIGGEVVTNQKTITSKLERTDVLVFGTWKQVESLIKKSLIQDFGLKIVAQKMKDAISVLSKY